MSKDGSSGEEDDQFNSTYFLIYSIYIIISLLCIFSYYFNCILRCKDLHNLYIYIYKCICMWFNSFSGGEEYPYIHVYMYIYLLLDIDS